MNLQSHVTIGTKATRLRAPQARRIRLGWPPVCFASCALLAGLAAPSIAQHDCLQWRLVQLVIPSGGTSKQVAVYDSYRGFIVAIDGYGMAHEWNGSVWTRVADAPGNWLCDNQPCTVVLSTCPGVGTTCQPNPPLWPPTGATIMGAAAFDANRRVTVVYDTFDVIREWDGQAWMLKQPSPSPGMMILRPLMTYHPVRQTVLMFGGQHPGGQGLNELWEWDGSNWTPIISAHSPPGRLFHGQAFDKARSVLVIFGGRSSTSSGATFYDDIWEWDGTDWQQRFPPVGAPSPGIRYEHAMAYDSTRRTVVMVGGNDLTIDRNDVWDWDGQTWRLRNPQPDIVSPFTPVKDRLRRRFSAYDSSRQILHLIGGHPDNFHWIIEHPTTPEVASGPVSQNIMEGNPVAFSVVTDPPTTVEFQWRKNGVDIPDANTAGYGISSVTMADQGLYDVVVSRSGHDPYPPCGVVLSPPATLTVSPAIPADLNADGAVDMLDFADFATMFTGPGE